MSAYARGGRKEVKEAAQVPTQMKAIRYIHASDLHLDAPFLGISQRMPNGARLAQKLHEATFTALSRLENLCLEQNVDFLVLTGDLTNSEEQSIRARLALHAFCTKLAKAGIAVFMIRGNHDPLTKADQRLPENVTLFKENVEVVPFRRGDEVCALIHGVSLTSQNADSSLLKLFARDTSCNDLFQLGLLHATVHGSDKANCCVPCRLEELKASQLDAWALGHIHKPQILSESPCITYAGSPQGLEIHESGKHGCYLITASPEDGHWRCEATFHALAPIVWETVSVDVEGMDEISLLVNRLADALEKARTALSAQASTLIVRLILQGATNLDRELQRNASELLQELSYLQNENPELWIHDLNLQTNPPVSLESYRARDDLLGACLREAELLAHDQASQEAFFAEALKPILNSGPLKKILPALDEHLCQTLLEDAQKICLFRMEDGRVH